MRRRLAFHLVFLCTWWAATGGTAAPTSDRPNIVIVMADDMGFSDIGCYGGEVRTPNLDALAAAGLRFTQFYNTARCCPTRASLLTGLYPHQAGVGHMVGDRGLPGYRGRLLDSCATIAEVLRPAGYFTAIAGKWHVSPFDYISQRASDRPTWPCQRGFDTFHGTLSGGGNYFGPKGLMRDNQFIRPSDDFYFTDVIATAAVKFIHQAVAEKQPLFLYVAFTAPHWPLHAPAGDINKYEDVYEVGWDEIRQRRLQCLRRLGLVKRKWKLTDRDRRVPAWDQAPNRVWEARRMAVYAAQIDRMDQGIGRIVQALEQTGRVDNTLVLFLADNGGCAEVIRMPGIKRFAVADQSTERWGTRPDVMPGSPDTFASYGIGWANASNTPFRLYKHFVHEGGIATPLIAHWPKRIHDRGALRHQPSHVIDLMATCVDVAGVVYPTRRDGHAITPLEGVSLVAAFENRPIEREAIFWEHEGNRAIRVGRWKLVTRGARGPWELYDLEEDRSETRDLAAKQPDRTRKMALMWDAWAHRCHVEPGPWERHGERG